MQETPQCSLHWWVQTHWVVAYTGESTKILFPQKSGVGYTWESWLSDVGYTGRPGLDGVGVGYIGE